MDRTFISKLKVVVADDAYMAALTAGMALENPRPFVESPVYAGPDRRRREANVQGPERRGQRSPQQKAG